MLRLSVSRKPDVAAHRVCVRQWARRIRGGRCSFDDALAAVIAHAVRMERLRPTTETLRVVRDSRGVWINEDDSNAILSPDDCESFGLATRTDYDACAQADAYRAYAHAEVRRKALRERVS